MPRHLVDKGLVKARNCRRDDRKTVNAIVPTQAGLLEKMRLTRAFPSQEEAQCEDLHRTMATLKAEVAEKAGK